MSKVLIAEDEPALLESYAELVSGLGHECLQAQDGDEAIELARKHRPDLVVTDYMLPGRTGAEVIRALRADPVLSHVPTILLTAGRPPESAQKEAWLFLKKPLSLERFERAIQDGLAANRGAARQRPFVAAPAEEGSEVTLLREEMLSWVSHEIKSPLSAAMMAAQLALRNVRSGAIEQAPLEDRLSIITRQLARMDELVTSILDAAQLQGGQLKLDLEEIEIGAWLAQIVGFWRELQPDHEITLEDGHELTIRGDRERLRQVLDNLISNAIKYGKPSKHVRVVAKPTETGLEISVQDEGPGIPAEELPTIFDRFHRVAGQGGRGHGLGLYIAAALARLHGGAILVESELGVGSTFTLSLPRAT